ncbi:TPA: hypothetical protein QB439_002002 [Pasteurella multocida]|nr:hypothetical protein [Pasteurella multocida]
MNKLKEHRFCLDTEEAKKLIDLLKFYDKNLVWHKSQNARWRNINFIPYDRAELSGVIPGVTVQIEFKFNKRVKESSKLVLTLFSLKIQEKLRAYQLEVSDEGKVSSHDGVNFIKGCHEHIGKETLKIHPKYTAEEIYEWFSLFCDKINLEFKGEPLTLPRE